MTVDTREMTAAQKKTEADAGTRIWCDRAPYDVAEGKAEVERIVGRTLQDEAQNAKAGQTPVLLNFTCRKRDVYGSEAVLHEVSLVTSKISAIETIVVGRS